MIRINEKKFKDKEIAKEVQSILSDLVDKRVFSKIDTRKLESLNATGKDAKILNELKKNIIQLTKNLKNGTKV